MIRFKNISRGQLKSYQKLTQKKYRHIEGKFIVEGERSIKEALTSDWEIEALLVTERGGPLIEYGTYKRIPIYQVSERELNMISDTVSSQGIIAIVKQKKVYISNYWMNVPAHAVAVMLDGVSDPGNVGTIIRTSDWFGVDAVLLSRNCVELYNQKVVRSTMGSLFHIPIVTEVEVKQALEEAKSENFVIITTVVDDGVTLTEFNPPERSLIIFGNEAQGVSPDVESFADVKITVPKFGSAESLNVGIAAGIILYYFAISRV